jgi:hypothetical protein
LYYFSLPFFHELDPRTTRTPIKVHAIYQPVNGNWERISSEALVGEQNNGSGPVNPSVRKVIAMEAQTASRAPSSTAKR